MAVEIDDRRKKPEPINVDLQMLRYQVRRVTGRNYELATNYGRRFVEVSHNERRRYCSGTCQ
jgi:hypothetical protein